MFVPATQLHRDKGNEYFLLPSVLPSYEWRSIRGVSLGLAKPKIQGAQRDWKQLVLLMGSLPPPHIDKNHAKIYRS